MTETEIGNRQPHDRPEPEVASSLDVEDSDRKSTRVPIVAIGASAGGIEALGQFFAPLAPDSGLGFVVVQHLDPDHESLLPKLIARYTPMAVLQAQEGMTVQPNHVYVIPPRQDLTIQDGVLHLVEREVFRRAHLPIDIFFRSLADDLGYRAIGVVLSGTGTDGVLGITAIKEAGGVAMVQEPASAQYSGMPQSARATGLADYVLPAPEMAQALMDYVQRVLVTGEAPPTPPTVDPDQVFQEIFAQLRAHTGHDFGAYKRNTVERRVQRRIAVNRIDDLVQYARFLRQHPEEVRALFKELLICVTRFFRDAEAFAALEEAVIPELFLDQSENGYREAEETIRVWVPGCATGEEAYSIAILIHEGMERLNREFRVQIFATDIDEEVIEEARLGVYPENIVVDVPPERLQRYFEPVNDTYRIVDSIRSMVVFAPQSVIKDPPFSRLDLISCRNLLIYLRPELQKQIVALFQYALRPGGFLFLGTSETPVQAEHAFEAVDHKWKIFRYLPVNGQQLVPLELPALPSSAKSTELLTAVGSQQVTARQMLERVLLERHTPPTLVVNDGGRILFTYGRVGRYLEPAAGEVGNWDIHQVLLEDLRIPLGTTLRQAATGRRQIVYKEARFERNGEKGTVNLVAQPLERPRALKGLILVRFEEPVAQETEASAQAMAVATAQEHDRVQELERELQATREYLQATIEELQSSNEEIRSTNEELQSSNEELETAQEEAQSVNEELATVNDELETKVDELTWANSDMQNLLASVDVGIIFLDRRMRVRRFNQAATDVVNLIAGDVGRPFDHIATTLQDQELEWDTQQVFDTLAPREQAVQTEDGRWYAMRIRPYRTREDAIEGVVLTFSDITFQKQAQQEHQRARLLAESIVDTMPEPLLVLDGELRVVSANRSLYEVFQATPQETKGKFIFELGDGQWDIPELRRLLEEILPQQTHLEDFEVTHEFPQIGRRTMLLSAHRVQTEQEDLALILITIEDVTDKGMPDERREGKVG